MKKNHILIIDDSELDHFIAKKILMRNHAAHTISSVFSGKDALTFLDAMIYSREPFPDVIFLALDMMKMTGFQFLDKYIGYPSKERQNTSVFILSAINDTEYIQLAMQMPFIKKYLHKPLTDAVALKVLDEIDLVPSPAPRSLNQFYVK